MKGIVLDNHRNEITGSSSSYIKIYEIKKIKTNDDNSNLYLTFFFNSRVFSFDEMIL